MADMMCTDNAYISQAESGRMIPNTRFQHMFGNFLSASSKDDAQHFPETFIYAPKFLKDLAESQKHLKKNQPVRENHLFPKRCPLATKPFAERVREDMVQRGKPGLTRCHEYDNGELKFMAR